MLGRPLLLVSRFETLPAMCKPRAKKALSSRAKVSLKLALKCLLSQEKVKFTSNITSFFFNETYIDMMKGNFSRKYK